jgi:hypothetical protein
MKWNGKFSGKLRAQEHKPDQAYIAFAAKQIQFRASRDARCKDSRIYLEIHEQ